MSEHTGPSQGLVGKASEARSTAVAEKLRGSITADARMSWLRNALWVAILLTAAAALYAFQVGRESLGASEAYSALAATQPTVSQVARTALRLDPGKPVLYHLLLHWFCACFGNGEASLRAMSVLFALAALALVYALARELFGPAVAIAVALLWALHPLAILFAQWARMYSMFIAVTLAYLLAMARLRRRPTAAGAAMGGLLGAVMLYTHLGGVLIIAAETAMVVRDFWLRKRSDAWPAVAIAIALFAPFIPLAVAQGHSLIYDHWLDWIGARHQSAIGLKLGVAALAAAAGGWLVFGKGAGTESAERMRWCAAHTFVPILLLAGGSVLVRPMFQVRYVAPSFALLVVMLVCGMDAVSPLLRRWGTAFLLGIFTALLPWYQGVRHEPWREVARQVEKNASSPAEPVVFESGFFAPTGNLGGPTNDGFPDGFYRVPFDYYFHSVNPRAVVPASDPIRARDLIAVQLDRAGGIWLVSGKTRAEAMREVPDGRGISLVSQSTYKGVLLLHLKRSGA